MTRDLVPGLPWDNPDADPLADLRAYIEIGTQYRADQNLPTHDPATCMWCRYPDAPPYSIYGPGQAEERMSPDAAHWNPSLEEEEAIIESARAVSIDAPLPMQLISDAGGALRITFREDQHWQDRLRSIRRDPGPVMRGQNPDLVIYDEIIDFGAYDNSDRDIRDTFGGETDVEALAPRDVDPPDID